MKERKPKPAVAFSDDLAREICERLIAGETLTQICDDDHMPVITSVWRWTRLHEQFGADFAEARYWQTRTWADEMIDIADAPIDPPADLTGKDLSRYVNRTISARMQQITTRQWLVGKINRAEYGDAKSLELTGKDGGPIQTQEMDRDADAFTSRLSRLAAASGAGAGVGETDPGDEGGA